MEEVTTQTAVSLSMVDTNVFVYFLYDASPQYAAAQALLNQARQPKESYSTASKARGGICITRWTSTARRLPCY